MYIDTGHGGNYALRECAFYFYSRLHHSFTKIELVAMSFGHLLSGLRISDSHTFLPAITVIEPHLWNSL